MKSMIFIIIKQRMLRNLLLAVLLFHLALSQNFHGPCPMDISQLGLLNTYTAAATPGTGNLTISSSSLSIPGYNANKPYKVYSGTWDQVSAQTMTLAINGYSTTVGDQVYAAVIGTQKATAIAAAGSHSGDTIITSSYATSQGFVTAFFFKASEFNTLTISLTASETSSQNGIAIVIGKISLPKGDTYSCEKTCDQTLNAFTVSGTTYDGAFCGTPATAAYVIPDNPPIPYLGFGLISRHDFDLCIADPPKLQDPSSWTVQDTNSKLAGWAKTTQTVNGMENEYYNGTWASYTEDETITFQIKDLPADVTNSSVFTIGLYFPENVTFESRSMGDSNQKIMVVYTKDNDTYITFRKQALPITIVLLASEVGTNMEIGADIGLYKIPTVEFECGTTCEQVISPMVFGGSRYAGAICWGAQLGFALFGLVSFAVLF